MILVVFFIFIFIFIFLQFHEFMFLFVRLCQHLVHFLGLLERTLKIDLLCINSSEESRSLHIPPIHFRKLHFSPHRFLCVYFIYLSE
jgi:hypothetical protein